MKTHVQLVQEWKEKFEAQVVDFYREQTVATNEEWNREIAPQMEKLQVIFMEGMLAAAKGAVKAGKVAENSNGRDPIDFRYGWDACISRSKEQLREYFK